MRKSMFTQPELEILARYRGLREYPTDSSYVSSGRVYKIRSHYCWKQDWRPDIVPSQGFGLVEKFFQENPNVTLDKESKLTEIVVLKTIVSQSQERPE